MKKFIAGLILGAIITSVSVSYSVSQIKEAYYNPDVKIRADGEYIDAMPVTVVEEGQIYGNNYLPVRALGEALGYKVSYDPQTKIIDLDKPTVEDVVEKVKSGCVMIRVYDKKKNLVGVASGVIYNDYIITAKHVLDMGVEYGITYDNMDIDWGYKTKERINIETDADIGLLKAPQKAGMIELGDSDKLEIGEDIVTVSSPGGYKNLAYGGKITNIDDLIYISALTYPGSSGGGLFNMQGQLIGIISGGHKEIQDINHVTPINEVKKILNP